MYSAIAPLMLLLVGSVWTYPAMLEELVKWVMLRKYNGVGGIVVGLTFGLSEAVLFSTNAWSGGQWGAVGMRLLLTVPMHTLTAMIIAWGIKYKMGFVGLGIAMSMHAGFNYFVSLL